MKDICINNFSESAKIAQRYIIVACTISITLYLLATIKNLEKINIINLEVDALSGITIFFVLYIGVGMMIAIQMHRLNENYKKIENIEIKDQLMLNPSIVCGHKITRIFSLLLPVALFGVAMQKAYGEIFSSIFMVYFFSIPYFFAISAAAELSEDKNNKSKKSSIKFRNFFKKTISKMAIFFGQVK